MVEVNTPPADHKDSTEAREDRAREKNFLSLLLQAQKQALQRGESSAEPYVTPEASPDKILPASLTAAPMKKSGILHIKEHEVHTPPNQHSLAELRRHNLTYDQAQHFERIQRGRERLAKDKQTHSPKRIAAPLGKTISTMSIESHISVKSGHTNGSSPLSATKTDKLEGLFTPPPKFRLPTISPKQANELADERGEADAERTYQRDFGMTKEEIEKILRERQAVERGAPQA